MLLLFLLVCAISFVGSLHPGTVNLAVMQTTLAQSRWAGFWMALGGSLPEIGYSALAAGGFMLLPVTPDLMGWLSWASIPVFIGAGLSALLQKPTRPDTARSRLSFPFWKGLLLGSTNPQLLPFWSAVWIYLNRITPGRSAQVPVGQPASLWVFALGAATGAFGLLAGLVWLTHRKQHRVLHYLHGRWLNRLTGGLFIGMGLWLALQVLVSIP